MTTVFTAALMFALAGPTVGPKAPPSPSEHRWRLHAEITPLTLQSETYGGTRAQRWSLTAPGRTTIGFGRALGPYVLLGARLGAELGHSYSSTVLGNQRVKQRWAWGAGSIMPYVELRPLPERRVQPFALVEGGVAISGSRQRTSSDDSLSPSRGRTISPSVGGRLGLHAFVLPRLSIDADVGLRRLWAFHSSSPPLPGDGAESEQPLRLTFAGTLGLSGWW